MCHTEGMTRAVFTRQPSAFGFGLSGENYTRHAFRITHSLGFTIIPILSSCNLVRCVFRLVRHFQKQQLFKPCKIIEQRLLLSKLLENVCSQIA